MIEKNRLTDSNKNNFFPTHLVNFQDYITKTQQLITDIRAEYHKKNELAITTNSPFELRPNGLLANQKTKYGILLLHGLFDSAFCLRDIGQYLFEKNCLVRSILLPGHGSIPGDLLSVQLEEWIKAMRFGIESLKNEVDKIIAIGFSTGGGLALLDALAHQDINGLILFAPAIQIKTPFSAIINGYKLLNRHFPKLAWFHIDKDEDYARYESFTVNAAHQVYLLTKKIKQLLKQKNCAIPVMTIATDADEVVSTNAIINLHKAINHPDKQFLLYSNKNNKNPENTMLRNSAYPDEKIIDFSHISLTYAPSNPHYGRSGDYTDPPFAKLFVHKHKHHTKFKGAITRKNLNNYNLQRLTFNPDFDFMVNKMHQFIEKIN